MNQNSQDRIFTLSTIGIVTVLLCTSFQVFADENENDGKQSGKVVYADPVPNTPDPCDGGIGYQWTVTMENHKDEVQFIGHVGAKSWNEPPPLYEPPYSGWTHTSNWVALELKQRSKVEVTIERQEGVAYRNNDGSFSTARNALVPALSVYKGWQTAGCDDHRYNNAGNIDWMTTAQFIGNALIQHLNQQLNTGLYLKLANTQSQLGAALKYWRNTQPVTATQLIQFVMPIPDDRVMRQQ